MMSFSFRFISRMALSAVGRVGSEVCRGGVRWEVRDDGCVCVCVCACAGLGRGNDLASKGGTTCTCTYIQVVVV